MVRKLFFATPRVNNKRKFNKRDRRRRFEGLGVYWEPFVWLLHLAMCTVAACVDVMRGEGNAAHWPCTRDLKECCVNYKLLLAFGKTRVTAEVSAFLWTNINFKANSRVYTYHAFA